MSEGLKTTFELLKETHNEAAVRVLLPALDSPCAAIRHGALEAILLRRNPAGHREILRRLHLIDDPSTGLIESNHGRLTQALRDALLTNDRQLCSNGCRAAVWFHEYDLIPALVNALEDQSNPNADLAGKTLLQLVDLLYAELAAPREGRARRNADPIRRRVLGILEQSVRRFSKHRRREIFQAFLLLVHRDNVVLKQILNDPHHTAFLPLVDVLSKSQAPGVIGLLLSFLDDPPAPSAVLSIVSKRSDLKFLQYLLRKIGHEPSRPVIQNLKRIESVAWLQEQEGLLDQLDDVCQHAAVRLAMNSAVARKQVFSLLQYLLLHGKPKGRRAAAEALNEFNGAEANELVEKALDDDDPEVRANLVGQLRRRGILGSLARLVEMVDSPQSVVRDAARKSLAEFSFDRFLAAFDMLDDDVRQSTGMLVRKVDPRTIPRLQAEMKSQARTRRLRALAIAHAIDVVEPLEGTILDLLRDKDHTVRAEAAKALSRSRSFRSRGALQEALDDRSPAVQEAAGKSLRDRAASPAQPAARLNQQRRREETE